MSPFLSLPAELRNRIYDLVAATDEPVKVYRRHNGAGSPEPNYAGLTRACRQIRAEYSKIYRREARIHILYEHLEQWLQLVPVNEPPAKSVYITITEHDKEYEARVDLLPLLQLNARFPARCIFSFNFYDPAITGFAAWSKPRRPRCLNWLMNYDDEAWLSILRDTNTQWRPLVSLLLNVQRGVLELVFESDLWSGNPVPPLDELHNWLRRVTLDEYTWFAARRG